MFLENFSPNSATSSFFDAKFALQEYHFWSFRSALLFIFFSGHLWPIFNQSTSHLASSGFASSWRKFFAFWFEFIGELYKSIIEFKVSKCLLKSFLSLYLYLRLIAFHANLLGWHFEKRRSLVAHFSFEGLLSWGIHPRRRTFHLFAGLKLKSVKMEIGVFSLEKTQEMKIIISVI